MNSGKNSFPTGIFTLIVMTIWALVTKYWPVLLVLVVILVIVRIAANIEAESDIKEMKEENLTDSTDMIGEKNNENVHSYDEFV